MKIIHRIVSTGDIKFSNRNETKESKNVVESINDFHIRKSNFKRFRSRGGKPEFQKLIIK